MTTETMVYIWSLTLAMFGILCNALPQHVKRIFCNHKLENGTDAPQGKYPSQVSLQHFGTHKCGATILNEYWVLTAAHCVKGEATFMWSIFAGSVDLEGNGERHYVDKYFIHEKYDSFHQHINDIALIRLETPLTFSADIQPTTLPKQDQDTKGGSVATVIGWGYPDEVDIFVVADPDCEIIHNGKPHPSNICAGMPEGGKGQCSGDSGGPLWVNGQQVGIVSWSTKPCGVPPYPGVYTEVSWYIDWIKSIINKNLPC